MSSNGGQDTITASPGGGNATTEGDSFVDRAYEYGVITLTWMKAILKWSLVCEEAAQKEQTQLEKIIGNIGNDPTAPSDLHTVTETVMFDSATIMATLIVTFCIFYFIDFFVQIFGGFSVLGAADISPSLASIQPVIPTRTRRRKKSGSSMSRETVASTQPTSLLTRPDSTQSSASSISSMPMKDILTKSFRPSSSKEAIVPPSSAPPFKPGKMSGELSSETEVSADVSSG
ncbi:hypothetical protein Y032_0176g538 [Ancylostoma ceylanicum]|uniref:Uncharacterized protein n=1 Tax=Ancylostoma ceylanicum TaxID=53326 RepID=A0A016SUP0_9BILA|nr:hypothetical protein Y032_0176g538 [Ancylostoma ceylanicum]